MHNVQVTNNFVLFYLLDEKQYNTFKNGSERYEMSNIPVGRKDSRYKCEPLWG